MNKKQLIEAIADYPDDAQVVVAMGVNINREAFDWHDSNSAVVWALSSDPTTIKLEL